MGEKRILASQKAPANTFPPYFIPYCIQKCNPFMAVWNNAGQSKFESLHQRWLQKRLKSPLSAFGMEGNKIVADRKFLVPRIFTVPNDDYRL